MAQRNFLSPQDPDIIFLDCQWTQCHIPEDLHLQ